MNFSAIFRIQVAVAILFISVNFSGDMYILALPKLSNIFAASQNTMHQTMTIFMFGLFLTTLSCGAIIERKGIYRSLFYAYLMLFAGTFCCLTLSNLWVFFLGRFIQGLGCGLLMISSRILLLYASKKLNMATRSFITKQFSIITLFSAWTTFVSIFIGGYITHTFGTRAVFTSLLILLLILFAAEVMFFKSVSIPDKHVFITKSQAFSNYLLLLRNKKFIFPTLCFSLLCATIPIFYISYGFILSSNTPINPAYLGIVSIIAGAGFILGKFLSQYLFAKDSAINTIINVCCSGCALSAALMFISLNHPIFALIISFSCYIFFIGLLSPVFNAYITTMQEGPVGISVGFSLSFTYLINTIENYYGGILKIQTQTTLAWFLLGIALLAILINFTSNIIAVK